MGPAGVGIVAVCLVALVGLITSEDTPSAIKRDPRETHQSKRDPIEHRRRKLRSTAAGQLRGGGRKSCPPGSGVTVISTEFSLMGGCLAERDLFFPGRSEAEFAGPTGKIVSLPEDGGGIDARRHWFAALYNELETFALECRSEELASLVHPSEATWRCVAGGRPVVHAAASEFSVECGCDESTEPAAPPESQARGMMPVCESNGIPGVESPSRAVCCAAGCKTCGGAGCSSAGAEAGLTADDCCATEILAYREACSKSGTSPCYIDNGSQVEREAEDDEPCSVSALSAVAMEQLNTYERGLYLDPECGSDISALLSNCNFMGLGQRCRGCFTTMAGARKYEAEVAGDMLDWGEEATINFCPGTVLEILKES